MDSKEADETRAPKLFQHLSGLLEGWKDHRKVAIEADWTRAHDNFNGKFDDSESETSTRASKSWRSKAFYPLTEQKVTAAQAQLQDILFKGGKFPYDVKTTPIPDDPAMMAAMEQMADGETPIGPEGQQQVAQMAMDKKTLEARIKNMKKRLDDQFAESDAASVGLISIYDGALYGTAFLESPRVIRKKRYRWVKGKQGFTKKEVYEDVPTVSNLSPWDCWPDPECGGMVQNGIGFFHREKISAPGLQDLYSLVFPSDSIISKDADAEEYEYEYIKDEFDRLLLDIEEKNEPQHGFNTSEGPSEAVESGHSNLNYDVFTFSGSVQNKYLKDYIDDLEGRDSHFTEAIVIFCNQRVIKCVVNPFPGGRRPYHMVPWTKVPGSAFGRGVAQKIFDAQKNVNRLMRMYIDNKRLSGNLMTAIDKSKLKRGESLELYPGRNWEFDGAFQDGDVRKLIQPIFFPDVTAGVLEAIGTMVQWADQSSGVPRILEGGGGGESSTAYAENQKIASASKQLGLVLKNYDMHAWIPIVESFYDWNMEFLKDNNVKGDFSIQATGFATFENKHLRKLDLERLLLMSQQLPALQVKIKSDPIVEDWAIAGNIDPERYMLTVDEVAVKMQQQQQQQMEQQAAGMQMEQQKQFMEHQFDIEMEKVKGQLSAETRLALAQIQAQVKTAGDDTKKLMKLADIEAKQQESGGGNNGRPRRPRNSNR
jgi:hypothetical protein